jgi:hypothetical protein
MKRVMLIYDDFAEMTQTETSFKKVGLDVYSKSNDLRLKEDFMTFRPDIVVVSGKGMKFLSLSVASKIKELKNFRGKIVLLISKDQKINSEDLLKHSQSTLLESPVKIEILLEAMCKLFGVKAEAFIEKLQRQQLKNQQNQRLGGKDKQRQEKYAHFIKGENLKTKESTIQSKVSKKKWNESIKEKDPNILKENEVDRVKFTNALFHKK